MREERGYVAREPDPADKRRMRLYVTEGGRLDTPGWLAHGLDAP